MCGTKRGSAGSSKSPFNYTFSGKKANKSQRKRQDKEEEKTIIEWQNRYKNESRKKKTA